MMLEFLIMSDKIDKYSQLNMWCVSGLERTFYPELEPIELIACMQWHASN